MEFQTEVHHVQLRRDPDRLRHGRRGEPANAGEDLMYGSLKERLSTELRRIEAAGLYKRERVITSPQSAEIEVGRRQGAELLRQQLSRPRRQPRAASTPRKAALDRYGYGMASVRFICGTQEEHKQLEARISRFLGMEDTILYGSCFDANGGLFETLLGEEDAIISDALNHASIIDGVRLCKAQRYRYANNDMADLEAQLKEAAGARFRLIATDGVFSMDGIIANLAGRLRPRREVRRDGDGRRQPRRRLRRRDTAAARPSIAASRAGSTSSPARSARRWAAPRAATRRASARWSTGCASARGPICSPTRWRRRSPARR